MPPFCHPPTPLSSSIDCMLELFLTPMQSDVGRIGRLIQKGEAKLKEYQHPDPYIGEDLSGGLSLPSLSISGVLPRAYHCQ